MELYATGFNAHSQLLSPPSPPLPKDLLKFQKIATASSSIRVLCALWSTTILAIDDQLFLRGFHGTSIYHHAPIAGLAARDVKTVFGNATGGGGGGGGGGSEEGVIGALGWKGGVWRLIEGERDGLGFVEWEVGEGCWLRGKGKEKEKEEREGEDGRGVIDWVVVAENGQVCCVVTCSLPNFFISFLIILDLFCSILFPTNILIFKLADPNPPVSNHPHSSSSQPFSPQPGTTTLLHTFPSLSALLTSPSPQSTHPLPSPPIELLASSTSFTALHPSQILTWGSPLHSHLGRTPTSETPASMPGPVLALGGIPIRKVAARGWMTAALSRDHELYVWGGRAEERAKIGPLRMRDGEEVALVDVGLSSAAVIDGGCRGIEGVDRVADLEVGEEDEREVEEEEGILDVAVGESHIIVLTTTGRVSAVGEGKWGQLGTGRRKFEREWVHVHVPLSAGATERESGVLSNVDDDDVDNMVRVEGEAARRPGQHTSKEKSTGNLPREGDFQRRTRRKIVGVECGFWNSFLLVSVGD